MVLVQFESVPLFILMEKLKKTYAKTKFCKFWVGMMNLLGEAFNCPELI